MSNDEGFTFTGQAKLKRIDPFVSKAGKTILTLIFEIDGQYPQTIPVKLLGRLVDDARDLVPGSVLKVTGRLGGRDWQGRVFGDIVATRINVIEAAVSGSQELEPPNDADDAIPF